MNKAYFLVPLIAVILFGGYYWSFRTAYEKKLDEQRLVEKEKNVERLKIEAKNREIAIQQAVKADLKRKEERAAKTAKENEEKEARQAAVDARSKAMREQGRLENEARHLAEQVATVKEEIGKIEELKKSAITEQNFLNVYVKQAQANVESLKGVLDKIEAADVAAAKYAKDQAAAAAKKS
jgi:colicin import membrane protein